MGYRLPYEAMCFVADPSGLEPKPADSESVVLPLTPRVMLPEQESNLQSRINNPLVYRLTDRGIVLGHERAGIQTPPLAKAT